MQEQQTIKSNWSSEGFRANDYLKRCKEPLSVSERQSPEWEANASLLINQLRRDYSSWGIAKAVPPTQTEAHISTPVQLSLDFEIEERFRVLADKWLEATEYISNLNKAIAHPAYQQIIGMGKVVPDRITTLLLKELELNPDHWLVALHEITGEDPAQSDDNFEEAVEAWLNWGRHRDYLTRARP